MLTVSGRAMASLLAMGMLLIPRPAVSPPPATDDPWYVYYDRGLRAIERSDWDEALMQLDGALERKDRPSANARTYGMRFIRYFPHFYTGVAEYNRGRTAEALEAFRRSREAGEVRKSDRHEAQLELLMAAATGPEADAATLAAADASRARELQQRMQNGVALLEAGDPTAALAEFEAVLAGDPGNAEARGYRDRAQRAALEAELERIQVATPAVAGVTETQVEAEVRTEPIPQRERPQEPEPAEPEPVQAEPEPEEPERGMGVEPASEPALTEAAILESKAWEILRRGRGLYQDGQYSEALAKFNLVLALAAEVEGSRTVAEEARRYAAAAESELAREAEARRQAEIAAAQALQAAPPRIAVVTPTNPEEPVKSEIVRLQGVVMDNRGVADVQIEVNGRNYGAAQTGRRGLGVVARPGGQQRLENQGTAVNFYHDIHLDSDRNTVVIRARNIDGLVTEERLDLEVDVDRPQIWAAVIGIGDYSHGLVPDLNFTVPDAEAIYDYLIDDLGVPEDQVFKLIDSDATTQRMKSVLGTELRRRAGEDDLVIIYYAGHGAPELDASNRDGDGLEKYLLSWEADPEDLYGTAFSMNEIANIFGRIQAQRVIFIADACYSGASGGRTFGGGMRATISDAFLDRISGSGRGRVILSASSANEPSQERSDLGHGVFTYFLLEGLKGAADANQDGVITVDEAYNYVAEKVPESTGQSQHPVKKGEVEGELILGRAVMD